MMRDVKERKKERKKEKGTCQRKTVNGERGIHFRQITTPASAVHH
jgi:hypothetical protein